MKGLLLKDLYMSAKYFRTYLLIVAVFLALSWFSSENMFVVFYPCLICGIIPVNLLAYDERSKWDVYSGTLPCTRAQIVSVKYLIGLLAQVAILAITGIVQAIRLGVNADYAVLMAMLMITSFVSASIPLPFMFKLGVEKGRIAYYVMIGLVCGGSVLAAVFFDGLDATISFSGILPVLCLASVAVYALSWYLSIKFYRAREIQ